MTEAVRGEGERPTNALGERFMERCGVVRRGSGSRCYAGDYTGRAIMRTLARKGTELGIRVEEDQYVSRLLVADGTCVGAIRR